MSTGSRHVEESGCMDGDQHKTVSTDKDVSWELWLTQQALKKELKMSLMVTSLCLSHTGLTKWSGSYQTSKYQVIAGLSIQGLQNQLAFGQWGYYLLTCFTFREQCSAIQYRGATPVKSTGCRRTMQNQSHMPQKYTCPRLKSFQSCNHDTSKAKQEMTRDGRWKHWEGMEYMSKMQFKTWHSKSRKWWQKLFDI